MTLSAERISGPHNYPFKFVLEGEPFYETNFDYITPNKGKLEFEGHAPEKGGAVRFSNKHMLVWIPAGHEEIMTYEEGNDVVVYKLIGS